MELKVKTIWNCRVCVFWASLMTFLFLCTNGAMGAEEDSLKADSTITSRFRASLMVTQPSRQYTQSTNGHAFLHLQYPEENLDFCFSLESDNEDETPWNIITGNYRTRILAYPTEEYLKDMSDDNRIVAELQLNLTEHEIQTLWKTLDERMVRDEAIPSDVFTHGCSAELVNILMTCTDGYVDFNGDIYNNVGQTFFHVSENYRSHTSWGILFAGFLFNEKMYANRPADQLTYVPEILPFLFSNGTIVSDKGNRKLLTSNTIVFRDPNGTTSKGDATQLHIFPEDTATPLWIYIVIFMALQVMIYLLCRRLRPVVNIIVATIYTLFSLAILVVGFITIMPELHGLNWQMLFYNPLPLVLWATCRRRKVSEKTKLYLFNAVVAWAIVCFVFMIISGRLWIEQELIGACFVIQLLMARFINRKSSK